MKKRINVFLTHTEYHFIQSLNLALTKFRGTEFENHIHITKYGDRFDNIKNASSVHNIKITFHIEKHMGDIVKEILENNDCNNFFFFQENSIYNKWLAYQLKKKYETTICLGPDGYKPYSLYDKKHELLSMIKDTLKDNYTLYKNNIFTTTLFKSDYYRYGSSKIIDEVWLVDIDAFDDKHNKTRARLKKISSFSNDTFGKIKAYFKKIDNILEGEEGVILYLNQPFWTDRLIRKEISFLKDLLNNFDKKVYLKIHPGTPKDTILIYKKIKGLILIDSNLPAELYILSITKSIIFSGWSTALITNNTSCNYYFNLPIYKNCGAKAVDQSKLTILPHIKLIISPLEMKLPAC